MKRTALILSFCVCLAGCGGGMPSFLGRDGGGDGTYNLRREPLPDPELILVDRAVIEPTSDGAILRVDGHAPTQGYHTGTLFSETGGRPDGSGIVVLDFIATPPQVPQGVGPVQTRIIRSGLFVPDHILTNVDSFRVKDAETIRTLTVR